MQTKITIRNEAQTCYIDIEGTIGVAESGQRDNAPSSVATYEAFRHEVARIAEVAATQVVVNIRSTGGDVNDALLIYDALKALDARITTRCYGYTASAATIIAQAADTACREISSNAMYLIHKSTCSIDGDAESLENRAELLRKTDERLAQIYSLHGGGEPESYAQLMAENNGEGRWLTAQETVELGLADRIIDNMIVGIEIPEPSEEVAPNTTYQEEQTSTETLQGGELPTDSAKPLSAQQRQSTAADVSAKDQTRKALGRAAHVIIRYLLGRIAYRWDAWMASLEQRREQKRAEQEALEKVTQEVGKEAKQIAPNSSEQASGSSLQHTADTPKGLSATAEGVVGGEALPQDNTLAKRSRIALSEGQLGVGPTRVKPTEDPSLERHHSLSNERAYDEDAKLFAR